jgi:hypothetical protein
MPTPRNRPEFSYTPLAPGQIRLLWPTSNTDGLNWNLHIVSLDDPHVVFDSLSYEPGAPNDTVPIICNGQTLQVHRSLSRALPHIAAKSRENGDRAVWIDSICIDQKNRAEKSAQALREEEVLEQAKTQWDWKDAPSRRGGGVLAIREKLELERHDNNYHIQRRQTLV